MAYCSSNLSLFRGHHSRKRLCDLQTYCRVSQIRGHKHRLNTILTRERNSSEGIQKKIEGGNVEERRKERARESQSGGVVDGGGVEDWGGHAERRIALTIDRKTAI